MRFVAVLLLLLVATASVCAETSPLRAPQPRIPQRMTVELDCHVLTNYLLTFVGIRSGLGINYSDETCLTSSLMQMFLRETSALLEVRAAPPRNINVTLADNDQDLSQILALALVGRHFTARFQAGQVFFEYDPASQILTPNMPRCEYQRSFLVLLLFVSIVLLVFALVTQSLTAMEMKTAAEAQHANPLPSATPLSEMKSGRSNMLQNILIDFAHKRRVATGYTPL